MNSTLQQMISSKMSDGLLPTHAPLRSFAGFGSGSLCHGCDEPVLGSEVEHEHDFDGNRIFRFHAVCEAIRQALLKTDMTTVFGKLKFGNWAGPLGDPYTNQNIYSPDHSVLAQWLDGKLQNVWPKTNAETNYVFPDNTVKR